MILWIVHLVWSSYIGRMLAACLLAVTLIKGYGIIEQKKGADKVIEKSVEQGKQNNAKAKKNVDALSDDKYYDKRLRSYCRDCK